MSDVIVVLGVHRSGTSSVAGVMTKLGATPPKTLMPPNAHNVRGYFESVRFMEFHDELLDSAGSDWKDWRRFNPGWYRSALAAGFKARAKEIFEAEFNATPLAIMKDPRVCRFVPFWLDILHEMNWRPHIVIPVRSPLDVARSIKQREGVSITHGLLLWLRNVLDCEAETRNELRSIFDWTDFMSDWRRVSNKISEEAALAWPRLTDRSAHEIENFLTSDLVHNETSHAELVNHSEVHEWAICVYDALRELSVSPLSNSARDMLDQIRDLFEQSSEIFGRALTDYEVQLEDLESQKSKERLTAEMQVKTSQQENAALRQALHDTREAFRRMDEKAAELSGNVRSLTSSQLAERAAFEEQLQATRRSFVELELTLGKNEEECESLRAQIHVAHGELDSTQHLLSDAALELAGMRDELEATRGRLRQIQESEATVFADLRRRLAQAQEELVQLRQGVVVAGEEKRIAIQAHRDELNHARHQLEALREQFTSANAVLDETRVAKENLERTAKAEADRLLRELAILAEVHASSAVELQQAQQELGSTRQLLAQTEMVTAAAIAEAEKTLGERNADIARLCDQVAAQSDGITAQSSENAQLRQDISGLRHEVERHNATAANLKDHVEALESELNRTRGQYDGRTKTIEDHKRIFAHLTKQARAVAIRQVVERELTAAARMVRMRVPPLSFGLAFRGAQLRSPFLSQMKMRRRLRTERDEIEAWGFFDAGWYLAQNPDVASARVDPFTHFLTHGILEDRDPHPLFCSGWYRVMVGQELGTLPPLLHYLRHGRGTKRSPHPLFDSDYYLKKNTDVAKQNADALTHFLTYGAAERRDPHPLIWMERLANQSGFEGRANPLLDYLTNRGLFAASPHPLFDGEAYLAENKDVAGSGINPLLHYCVVGWREGRPPHRLFAGDWYLAENPDVFVSGLSPLHHYLGHGAMEQRAPHPLFDIRYYFARYRDARRLPYDPLSHYVMAGGKEGRETTDRLSIDLIRDVVPAAALEANNPLVAFLHSPEIGVTIPSQFRGGEADEAVSGWPPIPEPVYWLPQRLRNHIVERYGEASVGLYLYLMSVVERYGERSEAFVDTIHFRILNERLDRMAIRRRVTDGKLVDVSIIIPVYNNLVFTLTSVLSILQNETRYSYEIIIGDDLSSDATEKVFASAGGAVRLVRHPKNLGFLGNCNRCAELAKGRFIVLLNNDTLILPGWLDALIDPIDNADDVGFAGSKLINADGTLQEAGGIFWRDGSAWNYGRGDDPRLPQYNYLKDVDYVSGASIALPTDLWCRLGGFDREFAPAYCEDSDLAFRVRKAGLRTIYAPASELVHHEGKSHGVDTASGIKNYQLVNQQKLFARWKEVLEAEHFANGESLFVARDRSRNRPHILFVDHYIPQWDCDAGSRTMFHFLRMFVAAGFQVSFWPDNLNQDREYSTVLERMGIEVIHSAAYVGEFDRWMATNGRFFDYALLSRPHIAIKYYQTIRMLPDIKILYYGHDIHYMRMELQRGTGDSPDLVRAIEEVKVFEFDNWALADVVLYPSSDERDVVRGILPRAIAAQVPMLGYLPEELAITQNNLARFEVRCFDELIFVGGSHPPNVDALLWFARDIMPSILRANPRTRLNVVGVMTNQEIMQLESEAVVLRGRLSDAELTELYGTAGLAVIPLRFGGGVKGKTVEALLNAIPIVSTSIGMQGLAPDEPIAYVADTADDFAAAVILAQKAREKTKGHVERGLAFIAEAYSMEALRHAFSPFVSELKAAKSR